MHGSSDLASAVHCAVAPRLPPGRERSGGRVRSRLFCPIRRPRSRGRRADARHIRSERVYQNRARQHRYADLQAFRDGTGRDDGPCDARGRGTRSAVGGHAVCVRAEQPGALQESHFRSHGHRRDNLDRQFLGPDAAGRRGGAHDAGRRGCGPMERARTRDQRRERRGDARTLRPARAFRRTCGRGHADAGPQRGDAEAA